MSSWTSSADHHDRGTCFACTIDSLKRPDVGHVDTIRSVQTLDATMASLVAMFTIAVVVASGFGVDRQNTVAVSALTNICAILAAVAIGYVAYRAARRESKAETGSERLSHLRKTAPFAWASRVGMFVVFWSLAAGLSTRYLLSVAVPYSPGTSETHTATVLSMRPVYGRGRRCDIFGMARLDDGTVKQFCYIGGLIFKHRISDGDVNVGDSVVLTLRRNALGIAIVSLKPSA